MRKQCYEDIISYATKKVYLFAQKISVNGEESSHKVKFLCIIIDGAIDLRKQKSLPTMSAGLNYAIK